MEIQISEILEKDGNKYIGYGRPNDCFAHLLEHVEIIDPATQKVVFSGSPSLPEAEGFSVVIARLRDELEDPTLIDV